MLKKHVSLSVNYLIDVIKKFIKDSYAINYQPRNLHDYIVFVSLYFTFMIALVFSCSYASSILFNYKFHIPSVLKFMLFSGLVRILIMLAKLKRKI